MLPGGAKFVLVDGKTIALEERSVGDELEESDGLGYRVVRSAEGEPTKKDSGYRMTRSIGDEPTKDGGY